MVDQILSILPTVLCAGAAMLLGGLVFSGWSVAPVAVTTLSEDSAARFLRAFWPRYYRAGWMLSSAVAVALLPLLWSQSGSAQALTALGAALGMAAAMWVSSRMIPSINAARDSGDSARFSALHRRVVGLTGLGLLAGLGLVISLGVAIGA